MIVAKSAIDDLNQVADATFTFLTYKLSLREADLPESPLPIEIVTEQLSYLPWSEAPKHLHFKHSRRWRQSLKQAGGGGRRSNFISAVARDGETIIQRHQDGGSGRPQPALARSLPRTVLSTANASESPTALCAKREMQSWRFLALEASSLRQPDSFNGASILDVHGRHMPATLNRLIKSENGAEFVTARLAGRLTELVENVNGIELDRDEKRQVYSIYVSDVSGNRIPARGLSDGTLRFLALSILEEDPMVTGLICLEEPENGIHPKRLPSMIALLRDIALDPFEPCAEDNPLRQVIVNTHSPSVVAEVPDDSLVVVVGRTARFGERLVHSPSFFGLPGTWRAEIDGGSLARGVLIPYLNPIQPHRSSLKSSPRVADREDLQPLLPNFDETL